MPTGYTADVQDGKVTKFSDFAWRCARAFGALITMRDDPGSAAIPGAFKVDDYYAKSAQDDEVKIGRVLLMADVDCEAAALKAHTDAVAYAAEYAETKKLQRARYQAMIAKVEAWTPPSQDHEGMKKFMLKQLAESLEFDCGGDYSPTVEPLLSGHDWRLRQLALANESLIRSRESLRKEEERVATRNKWIRELRESLAKSGAE